MNLRLTEDFDFVTPTTVKWGSSINCEHMSGDDLKVVLEGKYVEKQYTGFVLYQNC